MMKAPEFGWFRDPGLLPFIHAHHFFSHPTKVATPTGQCQWVFSSGSQSLLGERTSGHLAVVMVHVRKIDRSKRRREIEWSNWTAYMIRVKLGWHPSSEQVTHDNGSILELRSFSVKK